MIPGFEKVECEKCGHEHYRLTCAGCGKTADMHDGHIPAGWMQGMIFLSGYRSFLVCSMVCYRNAAVKILEEIDTPEAKAQIADIEVYAKEQTEGKE